MRFHAWNHMVPCMELHRTIWSDVWNRMELKSKNSTKLYFVCNCSINGKIIQFAGRLSMDIAACSGGFDEQITRYDTLATFSAMCSLKMSDTNPPFHARHVSKTCVQLSEKYDRKDALCKLSKQNSWKSNYIQWLVFKATKIKGRPTETKLGLNSVQKV